MKKIAQLIILSLIALPLIICSACAESVVLPADIKIVEESAFYSSIHAEMLEIPDGCIRINAKAFAQCGISCVVLPDSLEYIASDAFDGTEDLEVIAPFGSYAYEWAASKGYHINGNPADDFTFADNGDGTCTLTEYSGSDDVVVVPDCDPDGRSVTAVGYKAFFYAANTLEDITRQGNVPIRKVYLPDSVKSIGDYAFNGRYRMNYIRLPKGLESIGEYAFYMGGFDSIELPASLKSIGKYAFADSDLASVRLPEGVRIDECAFRSTKLTSVRIPAGIEAIGNMAFSYCAELRALTFDEGIVRIGDEAFYLTNIESVRLPDSLRNIGDDAFHNCYQLAEVKLPEGLVSIGKGAFSGACIDSIVIPAALENIGSGAFSSCGKLKNVAFKGTNLSEIANQLFSGCSSLKSITLPEGILRIGYGAFYGCNSLESIDMPDSVTSIDSFAFSCAPLVRYNEDHTDWTYYCASCSALKHIVLSKNLVEIGNGAFQHCDGLLELELPETVQSIGKGAFSACNRLDKLVIPGRVGRLENVFAGVAYDKIKIHDGNTANGLKEIVIESGTSAIADQAFKGMNNLEWLTIPASVEEIGENALADCDAITVVCEIGSYAEQFCRTHDIPFVQLGAETIFDSLPASTDALVSEYADADGFLPNDDAVLTEAALKVYDYANKLMDQGMIQNCTYCEDGHSVAFYDALNRVYLYIPAIKDCCSGAKSYASVGVSGFSLLDYVVITAVDKFSGFGITGSLEAARHIEESADEYTAYSPVSGRNSTIAELIRELHNTSTLTRLQDRVIFWSGHGGLWNDNGIQRTALFLNEGVRTGKYARYEESHAVVYSGGKYCVTDLFFESVMPETDGGLFVCGSCNGAADGGRLANAILNKGFSAFVGATGDVWGPYSEKFVGQLAVHLLERDDNGSYITIDEAFARTQSDLGEKDWLYDTSFRLLKRPGTPSFRLAPRKKSISDYPVFEYLGHSYQVSGYQATFADAEAICEEAGGHLCTMSDAGENAAVTRYLAQNDIGGAMIGLYDAQGSEGKWDKWVTGDPVTFTSWAPNQPDWTGQTICILLTTYGYYGTYDYEKWDNGWDGDYWFICEWDGTLESTDTTSISNLSITSEVSKIGAPHTATFTTDGDIQGVRITMLRDSGTPIALGDYTLRNGKASCSESGGSYQWTVTFTPEDGGMPADDYQVCFQLEVLDKNGVKTGRYARSDSRRLSSIIFTYAEAANSEGAFGKAGLDFSYSCVENDSEIETALNAVLQSYGYSKSSLAEVEKLIVFVDGYGERLTYTADTISKHTALCAVLWRGKLIYATRRSSTLPDWPFSSDGNTGWDVNTLPDGKYTTVTETNHKVQINQTTYIIYPALKMGGINGVNAIRVHSPSASHTHVSSACPLEYSGFQAAAQLNSGINIHNTSRDNNKSKTEVPGSAGCMNIFQPDYDAFAAAAGFARLRVSSGVALANTNNNAPTVECRPVVIVSRKYGYEHIGDFKAYMDKKYTAPGEDRPRSNLINAILEGDSTYAGNG